MDGAVALKIHRIMVVPVDNSTTRAYKFLRVCTSHFSAMKTFSAESDNVFRPVEQPP